MNAPCCDSSDRVVNASYTTTHHVTSPFLPLAFHEDPAHELVCPCAPSPDNSQLRRRYETKVNQDSYSRSRDRCATSTRLLRLHPIHQPCPSLTDKCYVSIYQRAPSSPKYIVMDILRPTPHINPTTFLPQLVCNDNIRVIHSTRSPPTFTVIPSHLPLRSRSASLLAHHPRDPTHKRIRRASVARR
jgi:hypothetical protein